MRKKHFIALICILVFLGMSIFNSVLFSEEEIPEPPPDELIEEMLADEEIPEEVRRELEEMLKESEIEDWRRGPVGISPAEEEVGELEQLEDSGKERPTAKIIPSAKANRISLDLKGVDIIDVLKMLSARSNLNIVAGRNVRGRVTLFLKDVDIWDAFEIILAANDLAYEKKGDIINVMTERDYEQLYGEKHYDKKELRVYKLEYAKAAEASKALNQAKSKIGKVIIDEGSNTVVLVDSAKAISEMEKMIAELDMPVETKIFSLDYAKAEDIKTKISEMLTPGVGTIQVDERTNKLVITELTRKMPDITNVIMEMDEKHQEVLIEAKIVQIQLNDEYRYGVDWKAVFQKNPDEGLRASFSELGDVFGGVATGGTLTFAQIAHDYLDTTIEVLETVGKTNVISSPRITVLNNEEARVLVGTQQPVVTSTTTVPEGGQSITSETVDYIDVGVELTVTPTINKDGFVTMKIKPEVSSLGEGVETAHAENAQGNYVYPVSKSETETTVMVKDGHTIIIAGLIQDRDISSENKIPILGDIPLLGNLFKNKSKGSVGTTNQPEKEELVIFLTPYIVQGTESFAEAENVWYGDEIAQRDLLEQQMSFAVEDIKRKRSLAREPRPRSEAKDTTTRISDDIKFFKGEKSIEDLEERRARLRKEIEPAKEGGIVPDKVVTKDEEEMQVIIPPANLITPTVGGYYGYYENLRNRIYWVAKDTYPGGLGGKREDVKVIFVLASDGTIKGEPKILNKVDKKLAKAAKSAVQAAAPFPPFPKKMDEREATFKITITYQ